MASVGLWLAPLALPFSDPSIETFQRILLILIGVVTVAACFAAARITIRHERLAWAMMGLGALMMLVGDSVATVSNSPLRQPLTIAGPLPGILWLSAYVPYLLAFSMFLQSSRIGGIQRVRRIIDLILLILFVTLIIFSLVVFPIYGRGASRPLIYTLPYFGSLAVAFSLLTHIASTRPRLRPWHMPLLAALVVVCAGSVGDLLNNIVGIHLGNWNTLGELPWFLGYVLVGAGGLERLRHRSDTPRNSIVLLGATISGWGTTLSAFFFVMLPVFVYVDSIWVGDNLGDAMFSVLIAAAAIAAIARNLALVAENSSLRLRSATDALTGLFNHRQFHERLDTELMRAQRAESSVSVVAMDVDDFDRVNNVYGHAAGDHRLRLIADRLTAAARGSDIVCRVGGDEFAIIMPDTDPLEAYKVCLRLQDHVHEPDDACPLPICISIGIASLPEHAHTRDELVQRADGALYWAKFHGREQVVLYDATLVRSLGPEQRIARLEEESYLNMVQLLSSAVDARDPYTQRHSRRVAELAVALAQDIGLDDERISAIETASLLHDVGKIGVPDAILRNSGSLTAEEFALVREHPVLAARILGAIPRREILPWIAAHHERWDGTGYPDGLAGEQAPLESRIIALCDSFDAMTSDRPYRVGLSQIEARNEIVACAGTQFDPRLAARFVAVLESREAAG
ncbi:MAG: hypothetical protein CVT67_04165 [Actinobacteria bacterium HGW-Actinobacteria-7]|nr:MAG: hypothetical protein CVT67_04165 [Actinobacteria bacterium HGW-Actinobacteria-7]